MNSTPSPANYDWSRDADGIVTVTMDDPAARVNTMNEHFQEAFAATLDRLESERDSIAGVIIASAKPTWFAGGNLTQLQEADAAHAAEQTARMTHTKSLLRRLEQLGRPVVAALTGAALGGGLEIALACHRRIAAADVPAARFGFPEVSLGLFPGADGITRSVRMFGVQKALQEIILPATRFRAAEALALGLVDEVVPAAEIGDRAREWIRANPAPAQPWDVPGFRVPAGAGPAALTAMPALLRKQLKGAPMPAPRAAMAAAVEGAGFDFATASTIETRYFVQLSNGQVAKNMIKSQFFDMQHITSGGSRPTGIPKYTARKVGVLGAGMMGAGIAYATAKAGIEVVLKDVSLEAATHGKAYSRTVEEKLIARGTSSAERSEAILARIHPTDSFADFAGVDFVIEAVFESVEVKQRVFQQIEGVVERDAVLASNTSTLPITELAEGVQRPEDFIGVHFFSPVDKMALVEIIRGAQTSDAVLARAFDYVQQIRKTAIVVNDSRGFFTSRVIGKFTGEAIAAVAEGIEPASIEQAALQAGYPAGALQLVDELALSLSQQVRRETRAAEEARGGTWVTHPSEEVMDWLVDGAGRLGRKAGAGFYDYDADGRRTRIWPGLREKYGSGRTELPLRDLQERMLFAEALEAVVCLDTGVLTSVPDANIGSLFGIGFPPWTGGVLQYVTQYPGGLDGFIARARELAAAYGERFTPPQSLIERAAAGKAFL